MTQKPSPPANPFQQSNSNQRPGATSLASRLAKQPPPQQPANQRSGSLLQRMPARFGQNRAVWHTIPVSDRLVRFSLAGLGGSLSRLVGEETTAGGYEQVIRSLEKDQSVLDRLVQTLDEAWESYHLTGALLVYNNTVDQITGTIIKTVTGKNPYYLRATDPLLVLNVMARSRGSLLQSRAPLSFDRAQLERRLVADDPRLIKLVEDTGYIEEAIPYEEIKAEETEE